MVLKASGLLGAWRQVCSSVVATDVVIQIDCIEPRRHFTGAGNGTEGYRSPRCVTSQRHKTYSFYVIGILILRRLRNIRYNTLAPVYACLWTYEIAMLVPVLRFFVYL